MKVPVPISTPARRILPAVLAAALAAAGCQDPFGNRRQPLPPAPITVSLSDFRTAALDEPSAFQIRDARPVRPNQTSNWDFVYWIGDEGERQFRPRELLVEETSEAGLQPVQTGFEELTRAPAEGYVTSEPVAVDSGAVYAARSRQDPRVGVQCRRYAKVQVTSVDPEAGTVTFRHLTNPNCEQRDLEPDTVGQR